MKILGISGSPRLGGNSEVLLDKFLEGARSNGSDTEKIILNDMNIAPCQECENMDNNGGCVIQDDMQKVYKAIRSADILIVSSPIFFGSLSAQTKMMIDRFQCAWRARYILNKDNGYKKIKGVFLSVEGSDREDFFNNAKSIIRNLFAIINVEYKEELLCPKIDEKGDILKQKDFLERAYKLGKKLTEVNNG